MTFAEQLRAEGQDEEKINVVIKCLKEGAAIDFISKITDLSVKQINAISKEHQLH